MKPEYCVDCGCPLDVCCGNKKSRKESCVEVLHEHRKAEEERFLKLAKGDKKLAFKLWLLDGYRKKGGKVNKHIRLCLKSGDKCNGILLKNK